MCSVFASFLSLTVSNHLVFSHSSAKTKTLKSNENFWKSLWRIKLFINKANELLFVNVKMARALVWALSLLLLFFIHCRVQCTPYIRVCLANSQYYVRNFDGSGWALWQKSRAKCMPFRCPRIYGAERGHCLAIHITHEKLLNTTHKSFQQLYNTENVCCLFMALKFQSFNESGGNNSNNKNHQKQPHNSATLFLFHCL